MRRKNDCGAEVLIFFAIVALIAIPAYGVFLMVTGKSKDDKLLGLIILAVGIGILSIGIR